MQRDLDDKALYKAFRQWLPMGLVDTYELSWTAVGVYCMDYGDAVDDALGRRRGQAAVDAYVESVFAANPDERARCEAAAAENLKVKASLMAEFLEQEKAKVRGISRQRSLLLALTHCACVPPSALRAGGGGCCCFGHGGGRPCRWRVAPAGRVCGACGRWRARL